MSQERINPASWKKPHLTPAQWDEIRQRRDDGESTFSLAREFGVTAHTIYERIGRKPS